MHFNRSTLLVAGAALLAACGDKVTVSQYTPPTPDKVVHSVSVAPATATLTVGQSITLTAAVNADAGVATTVTWSSSDAAKASVSSAGVVTAVAATPGVAICAASTVDAGKKGCASVVVSAPTAVIPASVSINSITTGGLNTPVTVSNVNGQIDITLNVNPGNQTVSKIVLLVGGTRQDSQTYTAAQAAALRYAADEAVAAQTTFPQVVFSVNTAAFNATTGAPRWANGAVGISAQLYTTQGGASTASTASAQTNLTFNNTDALTGTVTVSGATANDAAGYRFSAGDIAVSVIPVSYSGKTLASASVAFGSAACNSAYGGTNARGKALTAPAAGSYAWTATIANSGTEGATNVVNYEFNYQTAGHSTCSAANAEKVTITAAQDNSGNNFVTGTPTIGAGIRLDNRVPNGTAGIAANPNGRANSWINDAVVFNAVNSGATSNNWIAAAIPDSGVGVVSYAVRVGTSISTANAASPVTSAAGLAASATNATYCASARVADAVGNTQAAPASCTATFGVDRYAPVVAFVSTRLNNAGLAAYTSFLDSMTVLDTGVVGNSGFSGTPIAISVNRRTASATKDTTVTGGVTVSYPNVIVDYNTAIPAIDAYYAPTYTIKDAAGNSSVLGPRVTLVDVTAPTGLLTPIQSASPLAGGVAQTFTSNAVAENLNLKTASWSVRYGASYKIAYGTQTTFDTFNSGAFVKSGAPAFTPSFFVRALQVVAAGDSNVVAAAASVDSVEVSVTNMAGTATAANAAPQNLAAIASPFANFAAGQKFFAAASRDTVDRDGSSMPATQTIYIKVTGTTTQTVPTFTRMEVFSIAAGVLTSVGTMSASLQSQVDNGVVRTWTYAPLSIGASGSSGTVTKDYVIVGYSSEGVGLMSTTKTITTIP